MARQHASSVLPLDSLGALTLPTHLRIARYESSKSVLNVWFLRFLRGCSSDMHSPPRQPLYVAWQDSLHLWHSVVLVAWHPRTLAFPSSVCDCGGGFQRKSCAEDSAAHNAVRTLRRMGAMTLEVLTDGECVV
jgi:hypothetical protein